MCQRARGDMGLSAAGRFEFSLLSRFTRNLIDCISRS